MSDPTQSASTPEPTTGLPYTHPHPSAVGECMLCEATATHKVAEDTDDERHPMTAYVCCNCFADLMGPLASRLCWKAGHSHDWIPAHSELGDYLVCVRCGAEKR